jgi:TRAP-type C4-dicarboxylate transport system permease small subunit
MLTNPEARRALRSIVFTVATGVLLYFVWSWSDRFDNETLREAMRWALAIVGLGSLFYGLENTTRALKFKAGRDGVEVDAGSE